MRRRFLIAAVLGLAISGTASADELSAARAEMATALAAQVDLYPGPVTLPTVAAAPAHAAAPSAVRRGVDPRAAAASERAAQQLQVHGAVHAIAHQAEAAAATAAGQAQTQAAKQRVEHPRPILHR
jgi:hypothetical protein